MHSATVDQVRPAHFTVAAGRSTALTSWKSNYELPAAAVHRDNGTTELALV